MSRSRAWYGLVILTLINLLNYLDRYILAGAMGKVQETFHLNDAQGGSLATTFMLVYMFASPLGGYLGDRMPRRILIAVALAIWSAATIGSGLAMTFPLLLVARAMTGVGEAGYGTTAPGVISDLFPPDRRSRMLAFFYTAMPLGAAAGFLLGGAFSEHKTWNEAFFAGGIPGVVLAVLVLTIPEPARGATEATKAEKIPFREGIKLLGFNKRFWVTTAGLTLMTFSIGGLSNWMPKFLAAERGFTPTEAGLTLGMSTVVGGFLGTVVGGVMGDWLDKKHPAGGVALSAIGLVLASPLMILAAKIESHTQVHVLGMPINPPIFGILALAQFFIFLNTSPLYAALLNVVPVHLRAFAFGISQLATHALGDAASPTLIGAISDASSLSLAIVLNAFPVLVGGLVLLWGLRFWRGHPPLGATPA